MNDIDLVKTVVIDADTKLVEKATKKLSASKSQVAHVMVPPEEITKKVNEVIAKYVDTGSVNFNKLIDESSVNRPTVSNAIAIQDFVRRLNGTVLKATHFSSSSIRNDGRYIKNYRNPTY